MRALEIAIIGMAGRFPGAPSVEALWENLRQGRELITFFDDETLKNNGVSEAQLRDPNYVKARGKLDGVELFDAGFFGMNPREAALTDPQHRLLLECAWEALENAGYGSDKLRKITGIFAGSSVSQYWGHCIARGAGDYFRLLLGNDKDFLASRVAYKLNLKGPAVGVQTACSTSLVAVHMASQSLLAGECDIALAGGVSVVVPQVQGYVYDGGISSPDGHCRAFDAQAGGTVDGSGAGVVVLKRLEEAEQEGDKIVAVIRGSAINNDGGLKMGYTVPSVEGQVRVIREALAVSGVDPGSIGYVEAHGTGTVLGDPIEVEALTQAYRGWTDQQQYCGLGSVKSNIGHLDAAAGVAGLIKAVLMLEHGEMPASLHYREGNAKIRFEESPFYVNKELKEWKRGEEPRRAGVSSFGIGGTNAHVVLEEAGERRKSGEGRKWHLLTLSARNREGLRQSKEEMRAYLGREGEAQEPLADIAYTLQMGRKHFEERWYGVGDERRRLWRQLGGEEGGGGEGRVGEGRRSVVYLFPGQGAQYGGMGRELYEEEGVFREEVKRCAVLLEKEMGMDIREVLWGAEVGRIEETEMTQPALFTVEYGLARQWQAWGVEAEALLGHSIGEYVAAVVSGVMSLEEGIRVVAARGRWMQKMRRGGMLAVGLSEAEVAKRLGRGLSLAAVNGERACVVSGSVEGVEELEKKLEEEGVVCRRLRTSHGFHSWMMEPMREGFRKELEGVKLREPQIPMVSNVSGEWLKGEEAGDAGYWVRQVREAVQFEKGLKQVLQQPGRVLLEVGPGGTLGRLARQQRNGSEVAICRSLPDKAGESEMAMLLRGLGSLWLAGVDPDWKAVYAGQQRNRVILPAYPFQRKPYWLKTSRSKLAGNQTKIRDFSEWIYLPYWRRVALEKISPAQTKSAWLIFADKEGVAEQIAGKLRASGHAVAVVQSGNSYSQNNNGDFVIQEQQPENYRQLVRDLKAAGFAQQNIIHLWSIDENQSFEQARQLGFYSLLYFVQALEAEQILSTLKITVVSRGVQDVLGTETLVPAKASILALCRVVPQECPNIACTHIDLGADSPMHSAENVLQEIFHGLEEINVAYRQDRRWVSSFSQINTDEKSTRQLLKKNGRYLITGGTGNIGMAIARHLAKEFAARLVLVGRCALPETKAARTRMQVSEQDKKTSHIMELVKLAEQDGGEVLLLHGDMSDPRQLKQVLDRIDHHYGGLDGIIQATGVEKSEMLRGLHETTPEYCRRHFRSKVETAQALIQVIKGRDLDFVVIFSSLSSVLGGLGMSAYAAANLMVDAIARAEDRDGRTPWIAIQWDGWGTEDNSTPDTANLISPARGAALFAQVMRLGREPQVLVSVSDLFLRLSRSVGNVTESHTVDTDKPASYPRPELSSIYVAPRNKIEQRLVDMWQELLGIAPIGVQDDFFALGGYSLIMMQMVAQLRSKMDVNLSLRKVIELPTVELLAQAIHRLKREEPEASSNIDETQPKLVEIQAGDSRPPLFCVHPLGGGVGVFLQLVRHLGPDQPFYAFQAANHPQISPLTLEDLAAQYVEELLRVQREGPYRLSGLSFGGQVAFEMARQLTNRGKPVSLLILLDTHAPDSKQVLPSSDLLLLDFARELAAVSGHPFPVSVQELEGLNWADRMEKVLAQLKKQSLIPQSTTAAWADSYFQAVYQRMEMSHRYAPGVYDGRIILFKATEVDEQFAMTFPQATYGWDRFTSGTVDVIEVPGAHMSICLPPNVEILAKKMTAILECAGYTSTQIELINTNTI
jgi:acyl transferase domain-containing protein/thioesterase domain-containing protein/acyl carrier protein